MTSAETFTFDDDLTVNRLGFGAMRIVGPNAWGPPPDPEVARAVLRRAVELGVDFIDTADAYGPDISEQLIHDALHPYRGVSIATKAGLVRPDPQQHGVPPPCGRPDYLRQQLRKSLRRLGVDALELWYLHRIDPAVDAAAQFGVLREAVDAGLVRRVGLCAVDVEEIAAARRIVPITAVQNRFNVTDRSGEEVLDYCEQHDIAFIPFFPLAMGALAQPGGAVATIAAEHEATPSQVALSWLLHRSPVMLPIPGTGSMRHLEENLGARSIELSSEQFEAIATAGAKQ